MRVVVLLLLIVGVAGIQAEEHQLACQDPVQTQELYRSQVSEGNCGNECVLCDPSRPPDAMVASYVSWIEKLCVQKPDNTFECVTDVTAASAICLRAQFSPCTVLPPWRSITYEHRVWFLHETCDLADDPNCPNCDLKQRKTTATNECLTIEGWCV